MVVAAARPERQLLLALPPAGGPHRKAPRENLSAIATFGRTLFLGTDEGAVLDRLTQAEDGSFVAPELFPLAERLDLPDQSEEAEIDIEGMDVEGNALWLVGSHSMTRAKPQDDPLVDLAVLRHNPNRHLLACLRLAEAGNGVYTLAKEGAARLPIGKKRGALAKALKRDPHLKPFFKLPAKENGFDIEGIAVLGQRVLLGLRGPVLRGIALVLELGVVVDRPGRLELQPIGRDGQPYRKHFLDLGGNGVRDLLRDGEDVLILAGPTADLDGRCALWRWRQPFALGEDSFQAAGSKLERIVRLPVGDDADHPEGVAFLPDTPGELLVVYDAPAKSRRRGAGGVLADVFRLPL